MGNSFSKAIKEKSIEWLVGAVLGAVVILFLVIWGAVPTAFWQSISDAVDKRVLWALLGLGTFIVVGETVYIVSTIIRNRNVRHHYAGVLWNGDSEIFCPKDETPLFQNGVTYDEEFPTKGVEIFECSKCDSTYIFKDKEGNHISFADAKKGFLVSRTLKTKKMIAPPQTTADGFDRQTLLILKAYGEAQNPPYMAMEHLKPKFPDLKPVEINYRLDVLVGKYLLEDAGMIITSSKNKCYRLSARGRAYVVNNKLV